MLFFFFKDYMAPPSSKKKTYFTLVKTPFKLMCFYSGNFKCYILRNACCIPLVTVLNLNTSVPFNNVFCSLPLS